MSNRIVPESRPRDDWSPPLYPVEAHELQEHYSRHGAAIARRHLIRALKSVEGFIYEFDHALTDGYIPTIGAVFKLRGGKIAIVFPRFDDETREDGTATDRSLTIHSMGTVDVRDVMELVKKIIAALPPNTPVQH